MIRPRRSLLFMPGSNARALEKARNLPADGIILDLEDSVAPDPNPVADRLSDINADMSIRIWAMIETARAVLHAEELAAASRDAEVRLAGFMFGPNDISRETRIRMQPGRAAEIP